MPELVDVAPGSPEWLAARRDGITATDIPVIAGLASWESPYSLFHRKLGNLPDVPDSPRFALGRYLEPYVAKLWSEATGLGAARGGLYRSCERPWQMATTDRVHFDPRDGRAGSEAVDWLLELKTWADADRDRWHDHPPLAVRAQVLWQMDVMGVSTGHVACLFLPSGELASYVIEHGGTYDAGIGTHGDFDELQACQVCADIDALRLAGSEFYARLQKGEAPSVDGSAATLAALKARYAPAPGKTAIIDPWLWQMYSDAADTTTRWQDQRALYQAQIREIAGDCAELEVGGEVVARFDRRGALRRVKAKEENDG